VSWKKGRDSSQHKRAKGGIFDRTGRVLVDNDPKNAITYTKMTSTTSADMLKVAEQLAALIEQETQ